MHAITKFWNGVWPSKKEANPNIQRRISRLFEVKAETKDFSPTLQVLFTQKNKVRRMKTVYEDNLKEVNSDTFIISKKSQQSATSFQDKLCVGNEKYLEDTLDNVKLPLCSTPLTKPTEAKILENAMKFLIDSDKKYIDHMEKLINLYVKDFKNLPLFRLLKEMNIIENQKRELFGPIEDIYDFHVMQFHPLLLASADHIRFFADCISMISNDGFLNCYIAYAMGEKECENRRKNYASFLDGIYSIHNVPYEFQPIQQLAKYHLVIKRLLSDLENIGKHSGSLHKAEEDLKKVMEKIYDIRNDSSHQKRKPSICYN